MGDFARLLISTASRVQSGRRFYLLVALAVGAVSSFAAETWAIKMQLTVPRVFENTQSKGYRQYESQTLVGAFTVEDDPLGGEPSVAFLYLTNLTHKVGGVPVAYTCSVDDIHWHAVGSNLTDIFKTRAVDFRLMAEPSYAIGEEATEDNSLVVTISGRGSAINLKGYVAGQVGCGCAEYGHKSPTRIWGTDTVTDIAATCGRFTAWRRSK